MKEYNHVEIEKKWQDIWYGNNVFKSDIDPDKEKYYILDMFPYPSGAGLHVGHPEGYTATDILSRYKRMKGFNVLHPMGWDAFGLPAENYAIKTGTLPRVSTDKNISNFKRQIKSIGLSYDWDREVDTTNHNYYKWTQWIFLQLFNKGLAYESQMPINWCPSCKTGLANEEVVDGKCDRCKSAVEKKDMKQWMLKITEYADRLLHDLDELDDWPEPIKQMQKNWIGKSEGCEFSMDAIDPNGKVLGEVSVYTTRIDTVFSMAFAVIAPDHKDTLKFIGEENKEDCLEYIEKSKHKSDLDRTELKEKTGVFTGSYVVNPYDGEKVPLWIGDFVLGHYGTGTVFGDAHDERDFIFAKKYAIPLKISILPKKVSDDLKNKIFSFEECFTEYGELVNSGKFDGLSSENAKIKLTDYAKEQGFGKGVINYKLRDWVFSRQRYWGEPIPLIHCNKCGIVGVPEKDLPVKLPETENYKPTGTGKSPLVAMEDWVNVSCPKCNGEAKRETNTMPQWAGSSWYWLRFMDNNNDNEFCSKESEKYWGAVDMYVGGAEHAVLHLLYGRFWHKVLYDMGHVSTKEPFTSLRNQGMILAEDGQKMSKSLGNVINPDEVVNQYGADTLRMYEMFMGPFDQVVSWDTKGIIGNKRFLDKVWKLREKVDFGSKKVIIIHGYGCNCGNYWIPELRHELIQRGYYVQTPSMPNTNYPKYEQWKGVLDKLEIDENTILIGHSLGGGMIPRYLDDTGKSVAKAILVAPCYASKNEDIDKAFGKSFDAEKVIGLAGEICLLHSEHDHFVDQDNFLRYKNELNTTTIEVKGGGHLNTGFEILAIENILKCFGEKERISDTHKLLHKTIKSVGGQIVDFKFNTAISDMMILVNQIQKEESLHANVFEDLLFILNPFAPHITEELWSSLGHVSILVYKPWPYFDEKFCIEDQLTYVIQINGKLRGEFKASKIIDKNDAINQAKNIVARHLVGNEIRKEIFVEGKLVNFVV